MPFKQFSLRQRRHRSRPATSDDQSPSRDATAIPDPASHIDTHDDIAMGALETSLRVLMAGSSLASKLPFIAPIAGLLFQALAMRDEVKQYKEDCEIVMHKLARIANIIVNLCEKYDLSEDDLPASLRDILDSLQRTRELVRIERVLKRCSKRKGIKGFLLRKDLLTRIKQCDVELSNVLQAFQAELLVDARVALIVVRAEVASLSDLIEAIRTIPKVPNPAQILLGTKVALDAVWRITLNAKDRIIRPRQAILGRDLLPKIKRSRTTLLPITFFFLVPSENTRLSSCRRDDVVVLCNVQ